MARQTHIDLAPPVEKAFLLAVDVGTDDGWTAEQHYQADDSNQLVTTLHHAAAQITVRYTDIIPDGIDVLVRHVEVTPDAGFTPTGLRLVYFENFSPTIEKTDFFPTDQTNLLSSRDYALCMSAGQSALVHFSVDGRPPDGDARPPDAGLAPGGRRARARRERARAVGRARHRVRRLAALEAVVRCAHDDRAVPEPARAARGR